jgi:PEP-CTERM motif
MRKTALALIAVVGVAAVVGAPTANAFATRSSVHSSGVPQESNKVTKHDGQGNSVPTASVPEPGTLALLASGVTAIGAAAWRRRRAKKDL